MMNIKHSVMVGMMGRVADKFHEYQPSKSLLERLEDAKKIKGASGIEVVFPSEFSVLQETINIIKESGLPLSALNLNIKSEKHWENGSFTNPDPKIRDQAVKSLWTAMDLAVELGTDMVSCCPLIDGHNFNFEVNYLDQWSWLEEGIKCGASYRPDVKVSLEYKLNECRNANILADMRRSLFLCERVVLPSLGVTMDVGHALMARETPAEVLSIASLSNRLFYVHFNDNDRFWDWDMIPGSVNLWDLLEVLYYLKKLDWQGWFSYDIVVRDGGIVETMEAGIANVINAEKLLEKIGVEMIDDWIKNQSSAYTFKSLIEALL
jgi:xylose isomerase